MLLKKNKKHFTPINMATIQNPEKRHVGEGVQKLEPLCVAGGNLCAAAVENGMESLQNIKIKTELPHDLVILLLGVSPQKLKAGR